MIKCADNDCSSYLSVETCSDPAQRFIIIKSGDSRYGSIYLDANGLVELISLLRHELLAMTEEAK